METAYEAKTDNVFGEEFSLRDSYGVRKVVDSKTFKEINKRLYEMNTWREIGKVLR